MKGEWLIVVLIAYVGKAIWDSSNGYIHKAIPKFCDILWKLCVAFTVINMVFQVLDPML